MWSSTSGAPRVALRQEREACMRAVLLMAVGGMVLGAAGAAQAASVQIKDAVARVTVIPENRADVRVEVLASNPRLPLKIRSLGGRTIVDGDLGRRIRDCRGSGENVRVQVRGVGEIGWR